MKTTIGRPKNNDLTRSILKTTLQEVADHGFHGARLDRIAANAQTSKQALYRRWQNKEELISEAVRYGFSRIPVEPPGSGSLSSDLISVSGHFQEALVSSPLGKAYLALLTEPATADDARLIEGEQRTFFRQMFVYAGNTAGMEEKIDLILAQLLYRCLFQRSALGAIALKNLITSTVKDM
ncbi:helix-turn-helix domain-containing protein [Pseudovibrio sp. SPO723]|uniref:TetR/AcrR family transcriptional regulator n=1 Tax=Nesiotobacter zosterae TaxID=392721 RepID=UPI0029C3E5A3|nr:helix-turn-helix domain-containing protein [Pseudovibrio sp. SPO723]MDX5594450.1 helix-turn-helix domain-containing protein [Pseudovibrio sp. SPO723]